MGSSFSQPQPLSPRALNTEPSASASPSVRETKRQRTTSTTEPLDLPKDLTIRIGLLIKKDYEDRISELESDVHFLERANLTSAQLVLLAEARKFDNDPEPFSATNEMLYQDERLLKQLFKGGMAGQLAPLVEDDMIYQHIVRKHSWHPKDFMWKYFASWPPDTEDEEDRGGKYYGGDTSSSEVARRQADEEDDEDDCDWDSDEIAANLAQSQIRADDDDDGDVDGEDWENEEEDDWEED